MKANKKTIAAIAKSVRTLTIDAVERANSGHPGLPLGMAELGALLFANTLSYNPDNPDWINRDRFILSAGHGSMFLYSLLHLSGFDLSLDDVKSFRQLASKTPGHPEYGHTAGVETTTGPLGAGISNAVGMAIAETMMAQRFNTQDHTIIDHYTYALAGDGCMMEGISSEAASLAGHLKLGKLILFYDSNSITIEGSTDLAFSEDVSKRFQSYDWQILEGSAYDLEGIEKLIEEAKANGSQPSLIKLNSTIGKGAPNKEGTESVHGAPLGQGEVAASRTHLGISPNDDFYRDPLALEYFNVRRVELAADNELWEKKFEQWSLSNPHKLKLWNQFTKKDSSNLLDSVSWPEYKVGQAVATRSASGKTLNALADAFPNFIGGSADLAPSNKTDMPGKGDYSANNREGRTLHFGVREHAMGGILNGMALHSGLKVFGATFLVFCDYMRPAIRLAALMKLPVIYVLTHDSIFVGEDGPTHQPVEQAASLRIIPNLTVIRPADGEETNMAWKMALSSNSSPTALLLTRQNLTVFEKSDPHWEKNFNKGAYIALDSEKEPELVIAASGSELGIALEAASILGEKNKSVRVLSVPSREKFITQDENYRNSLIPKGVGLITVEAGVRSGWDRLALDNGADYFGHVGIETFGESGPGEEVAQRFGLTTESIITLSGGD